MSAQVCIPGLALDPARSVVQASRGCPGPHLFTCTSTPVALTLFSLLTHRLIHGRGWGGGQTHQRGGVET